MSINNKVIYAFNKSSGYGFHIMPAFEAELQGRHSHAEHGNEGGGAGGENEVAASKNDGAAGDNEYKRGEYL